MAKQQPKRTKDGTAYNISELEAERNKLLVSRDNPKRLKEVQSKIDYFNYGIEIKTK